MVAVDKVTKYIIAGIAGAATGYIIRGAVALYWYFIWVVIHAFKDSGPGWEISNWGDDIIRNTPLVIILTAVFFGWYFVYKNALHMMKAKGITVYRITAAFLLLTLALGLYLKYSR